MTRSEQIIEGIRQEIRHEAETLTDPREFKQWCNEHDIGVASLSAATETSSTACDRKLKVGNPYNQNVDPVEYAKYSVPLTSENFPREPGEASAYWDTDKPRTLITRRLSEALDALPPAVDDLLEFDALYREVFGPDRAIDAPGFAFWWGKHLIEEMPRDEIEMHLRSSPEFLVQRSKDV